MIQPKLISLFWWLSYRWFNN